MAVSGFGDSSDPFYNNEKVNTFEARRKLIEARRKLKKNAENEEAF